MDLWLHVFHVDNEELKTLTGPFTDLSQAPHGGLLCVVRLAGIAGRWSDALISNSVEVRSLQKLIGAVAPQVLSHPDMKLLGEGLAGRSDHKSNGCNSTAAEDSVGGKQPDLSESIRQDFDHDAAVVVTLVLEVLAQLLGSEDGHGEQADVVGDTAVARGHKVRQTQERF